MEVRTTRFGMLTVATDDTIGFPSGLPGLEECRQWVLLADPCHADLAWLQSLERPEVALPVVDPRVYVEGYELRSSLRQLELVGLSDVQDAQVLAIVGREQHQLTLNLKAPVVINCRSRIGRQMVNGADWSMSHPVQEQAVRLRKSA